MTDGGKSKRQIENSSKTFVLLSKDKEKINTATLKSGDIFQCCLDDEELEFMKNSVLTERNINYFTQRLQCFKDYIKIIWQHCALIVSLIIRDTEYNISYMYISTTSAGFLALEFHYVVTFYSKPSFD